MKNFTPIIAFLIFASGIYAQVSPEPENLNIRTKIINHETYLDYTMNGDEGQRSDFPPIWDIPLGGGNTVMGITVKLESNPRVNNVPLAMNDYIGGFFTDENGDLKCGGAAPWPDTLGVVMSLVGDNMSTPEKEGFSYAEQIYFKFFSWERMKDYDVDIVEFDPESMTTDKWYPLGLSDVINMQALEVFDFYIEASANPLCTGDPVTLTANQFIGSNGNYSYSWSSNPPGFNYNVPNPPSFTPSENTTFNLVVQDGIHTSQHSLTVNINLFPTATASNDGSICEDQNYHVEGSATNYTQTLWSTNGDGNFTSTGNLASIYTPGTNDKNNGQAILTFTAFPLSPCTLNASDNIILTVRKYPTINAGPDQMVCISENADIPVTATGTNIATSLWQTLGDGTFSNPNTLSTIYHPGGTDLASGQAQIKICAQAISPCVMTTCDNVILTFYKGPTCNAPTSRTKCEDQPVPLTGVASNNSGVLWTTQGDGTFDNPSTLVTNYNAGMADRNNGGTIVTLNALAITPCVVPATKNVTIILKPLPKLITFGDNTSVLCPGSNYLQLDAQLENGNSFQWSTNGDGTFSSTTILNPKYFKGTQDTQNGYFDLKLTVTPVTPCTTTVEFNLHTIIAQAPEVEIFNNNGSSYCGTMQIDAAADYANTLNWQTNGDGFFSDPGIINPLYYPGTNDLSSNNAITLTLTGTPLCTQFTNAQSSVQVFFRQDASVSAGADDGICENQSFHIYQATASNFQNLNWTSSGNGTFSNPNTLNPFYYPGTSDISSGEVVLTLTAYSFSPCTFVAADQMQLEITKAPFAFAGSDATICEENIHVITDAVANNYTTLLWETFGDGTFNNLNIINPVYFPGENDSENGTATLLLRASGNSPCDYEATDVLAITIIKNPDVDAGEDITSCGEALVFGEANNQSSVQWSTSGDGTFANASQVVTMYYPGQLDHENLLATLQLTAMPISPCATLAMDEISFIINIPNILDDNVNDQEVIAGETLNLSLSVSNPDYGQFFWFKDGELIENQNGAFYFVENTTPEDAGVYQCKFINDCDEVSSQTGFVEVLQPTSQTIVIPQGWSGISSFVEPYITEIPDLFSAVENQLVILSNNTGVYWPEQSTNTLGSWSNEQAYNIKMASPGTVEISGVIRYPAKTYVIEPGWSFLAINSFCAVDIETLFSSFPEVVVIKEIAGTNIYWPEKGVTTLLTLNPGEAYQIMINTVQPVEITFPNCE